MAGNFVKTLFQRHPVVANSLVYGSLFVGAEFSQQLLLARELKAQSGEELPIDYKSLARYLVVGSLINSNYFYVWYKWLDAKYVGTTRNIILKKVFLDQFVMTPPLYVIFYASMSLMEGKEDLLEECRAKYWKTYSVSCLFWLPVQTINFLYLPNAARIVYMGLCSFVWANILCWIKRDDPKGEQ